jgi:hypothetical protein
MNPGSGETQDFEALISTGIRTALRIKNSRGASITPLV